MMTASKRAEQVIRFAGPLPEMSLGQMSNLEELLYTLSEAGHIDILAMDAVVLYSLVKSVIAYGDDPIPSELCM